MFIPTQRKKEKTSNTLPHFQYHMGRSAYKRTGNSSLGNPGCSMFFSTDSPACDEIFSQNLSYNSQLSTSSASSFDRHTLAKLARK
jgi:hypothetical protein